MVAPPTLVHELIKWATIFTSIGSALAGVYHFGIKVWTWIMAPRRIIMALTTNHFPHLTATLQEHTEALIAMQSDIRNLDTQVSGYSQRLDDTKTAVESLTTKFIEHLDKVPHASGV